MLGFKKTPDEVIRQLKKLGKESFEEYAWRMEEQWLTVNKRKLRLVSMQNRAAALPAQVQPLRQLQKSLRSVN